MLHTLIFAALIEQAQAEPQAATAAPVHVVMDSGAKRTPLQASFLEKSASDSKVTASKPNGGSALKHIAIGLLGGAGPLGQLAAQAEAMSQAKSASASMTMKADWVIEGATSGTVARTGIVSFDITYPNAPGVDAALVPTLIRLGVTPQMVRAVTKTELYVAKGAKGTLRFGDSVVRSHVKQIARGHVQLVPDSPLPAGEYAVTFRPAGESLALQPTALVHAVNPSVDNPEPWQLTWGFSVK